MAIQQTDWFSDEMRERIARRYRADRRFRRLGMLAIGSALAALLVLMGSIVVSGLPGFQQTQIQLSVYLDPAVFGDLERLPDEEAENRVRRADYGKLVREALMAEFPAVTGRRNVRALTQLASIGARNQLRDAVLDNSDLIGSTIVMWAPASDDVDSYVKGAISADVPEGDRRLKDQQIEWVNAFQKKGQVRTVYSRDFFTSGDSREPELAGIWGAVMGSALTLLVTLAISFPLGVAAAIYLEEFAPKSIWSDWIEVNINNLAAVPSIVYGLLGLAIFLNVFELPRSAPLVGGMTLALMTLPTIIIAARVALAAVPPSIRDAAMGLGASKVQVTFHHVLPLGLPGVLTGSIIGMARALGETAPLLMIGMVAFVVDIPTRLSDAATVLPVQVFLWADRPERAFVEKTSAAILVLLVFLLLMNAVAIYLREKFQRKW